MKSERQAMEIFGEVRDFDIAFGSLTIESFMDWLSPERQVTTDLVRDSSSYGVVSATVYTTAVASSRTRGLKQSMKYLTWVLTMSRPHGRVD